MESLKFKHIEGDLIKLVSVIAESQNIKRYIKYLDKNDPLNPSYANIVDGLLFSNIFMTPFNDATLIDGEIKMFIYPSDGKLQQLDVGTYRYKIDIFCPFDSYVLYGEGQIRPFRMADEIAKLIDGKNSAGIGDVKIETFTQGAYNKQYTFLTMNVNVSNATCKG